MTRRVFVDTDVILDLLLAREPFFASATRLFLLLQEGRIVGWTTPVVFSNLFYILRQAMPAPEAMAALRKLRLLVGILPVDEGTVDTALASSFTDFEDGLQYYAATASDLDAIVTRNKKDFRSAEIPVLNAEECVQWIEL